MSLHTNAELLQKAAAYCAYRERTAAEVAQKLRGLGATDEQSVKILAKLKAENFYDANRFAASFVRGKFNQNKWGRIKIKAALAAKGVDRADIEKALKEIDDRVYFATLKSLIEKKAAEIKNDAPGKKQGKLLRFALSKGYEANLAMPLIKALKA